jgi:Carboxypeptidase regulatory-like domain
MRTQTATGRQSARQRYAVPVALLLMLSALASCGQMRPRPTAPFGTIAGDVTAGPTCPVERVTDQCPPEPVQNRQVNVVTQDGTRVATTSTDSTGHFTVQVPPGSYLVQVAIVPGELGLRQITPGNVTIRAGETVTVRIELDTGIR